MRNRPLLWSAALVTLAGLAGVLLLGRTVRRMDLDSCLDAGGRWNDEQGRCDFTIGRVTG